MERRLTGEELRLLVCLQREAGTGLRGIPPRGVKHLCREFGWERGLVNGALYLWRRVEAEGLALPLRREVGRLETEADYLMALGRLLRLRETLLELQGLPPDTAEHPFLPVAREAALEEQAGLLQGEITGYEARHELDGRGYFWREFPRLDNPEPPAREVWVTDLYPPGEGLPATLP